MVSTLNPSPKGERLQTPEVTAFCLTPPRLVKRWGEGGRAFGEYGLRKSPYPYFYKLIKLRNGWLYSLSTLFKRLPHREAKAHPLCST
jgi:hypothetical protein